MNKNILSDFLSLASKDEFLIILSKFDEESNITGISLSLDGSDVSESLSKGQKIIEKIKFWVGSRKKKITIWICNDLNYCESSLKKNTESSQLLIAVTDSLSMWATSCPVPVILLSTYLIKYKVLDDLCKCE